jgi:DNA-binding NarL/FixJ family response regulator
VHRDAKTVRAAFAVGACGYVVKHRLVADLPVAMIEVLAGRPFVSPGIAREQAT